MTKLLQSLNPYPNLALYGGVIGLYILIDLEIHVVFINRSKIYRF